MIIKQIHTPLTKSQLSNLQVKDYVLLNGEVYTMRDQAHKRLFDLYKHGKKMPFDLKEAVIYYCGPTPTPPGAIIGSCGPTTSERMDAYTHFLLDLGVRAFIGKGERSKEVIEGLRKHSSIYFLAIGGAGSYYAQRVIKNELVCFKDLGPEAIYRLTVKDFDTIVGLDSKGKYIYGKKT